MSQRGLFLAALILIVVVAIGAAAFIVFQPEEISVPYSGSDESFLGYVKQGKVNTVVQQGAKLTITLEDGRVLVSQVPSEFSTNIQSDIEQVCAQPDARCVPGTPSLSATEPSQTGQILTLLLTALLPVVLIGGIFYFRRAGRMAQAWAVPTDRARASGWRSSMVSGPRASSPSRSTPPSARRFWTSCSGCPGLEARLC